MGTKRRRHSLDHFVGLTSRRRVRALPVDPGLNAWHSGQGVEDDLHRVQRCSTICIDDEIWSQRRLIGIVNPAKAMYKPRRCTPIQALRITSHACGERRAHMHLQEWRQRLQLRAGTVPGLTIRGDCTHHHGDPLLQEIRRMACHPGHVRITILTRESQPISVGCSELVAVHHHNQTACLGQSICHQLRKRRLARTGVARQPHAERLVCDCSLLVVTLQSWSSNLGSSVGVKPNGCQARARRYARPADLVGGDVTVKFASGFLAPVAAPTTRL